MITSAQNPKLKLARSLLGRPKERREAGAFVAEGVRLVEDALAAGWGFKYVLCDEMLSERGKSLVASLQSHGVDVEQVAANLMKSLSETETPQGILAVLRLPTFTVEPSTLNFILIPDQIRDPGNLGTLLRTAAAAGVQAVLLPPETTDAFAPKVVRAGMGAHFRLPIRALAWDEIGQVCTSAGLQVWLADMGGVSCWQADLRRPLALIVGGEAEGASAAARRLANEMISLPMPGGIESLNAAVAGAVLMFEVLRKRTPGV
jgi:TrmH family RNA methyltransferase